MALNFGEVVELNSRSFVTDGEEWSLDDRYLIETEKESPSDQGKQYEYLLVANGKIMSDFAAAFLISEDTQTVNRYKIVLKTSPRVKFTFSLYELPRNVLLFVCEHLPHVYFTNHLLLKIKPYMERAAHTVVLTSEMMSSYKPRSASQVFLRCLATRACTLTAGTPVLELPNTVSGLPAAVLSWCQAKNRSGLMYVVYAESSGLDSTTAEPVLQLLKTTNFLVPTSSTDKLKQFVHRAQLQHSNLYL